MWRFLIFFFLHQEESSKKGKQKLSISQSRQRQKWLVFFLSWDCPRRCNRTNRTNVLMPAGIFLFFFFTLKAYWERKNEKNIKRPSVMFKWIGSLSWCVSLTFFLLLFRLAISCIMWRDTVCLKRTQISRAHGKFNFFLSSRGEISDGHTTRVSLKPTYLVFVSLCCRCCWPSKPKRKPRHRNMLKAI